MRITNINSSNTNVIVRFVNAGIEMLDALLPAEQQRLQLLCAGQPANLSTILPGNRRAAFQVQLLTAGTSHISTRKDFGKDVDRRYLPGISERDWQMPGTTSRQKNSGNS